MRVLLDESCHRRIVRELAAVANEVRTVQSLGWNGVRNGELLRRVGGRFNVFVTQDSNLPRQNLVAGRGFTVMILKTKGGLWSELHPLMARLRGAERGSVLIIE